MAVIVDVNELATVLDKQATSAILNGRNKAYSKGIRDAVLIARSIAACTDASVPVKKGGAVNIGTWWYECGRCNTSVNPGDQFCRQCGVPIGWPTEEQGGDMR